MFIYLKLIVYFYIFKKLDYDKEINIFFVNKFKL